jgi:hypothetical protein
LGFGFWGSGVGLKLRMAVEGWEFQGLGIDGSELGFRVQDLGWRGWGGGLSIDSAQAQHQETPAPSNRPRIGLLNIVYAGYTTV